MSLSLFFLKEFISQNQLLFYIFTYLSIIFLGNIISFITLWIGLELKLNFFYFLIILILTYVGNISGDTLWFNLGKILKNTKLGYIILNLNYIKKYNGKFEEILEKNGLKWFIFSKFFYGSSPLIAFSLGWINQKFKKFLKLSSFITLIWIPILFIISYILFLSLSPLKTIIFFEKFEWIFILGLIFFILLEFLISKLIKKTISLLKFKIDKNSY